MIIAGLVCFECAAQPAKRPVETDPYWLSHTPGLYLNGPNGEHIWNTNVDQFWQGA